MDAREAIQRIQNHIDVHSRKERFAVHVTEAFKMAIAALEKQIPKKPQAIEADDIKLCFCPCCKVRFMRYGAKHCGECGQALDWN